MENYSFSNNTPEILNNHEILDEDSYIIVSVFAFIALVGIPGNVIIVAVIAKLREISTTDYYVLAMAAFDLLSLVVNTTCYILRNVPSIWTLIASIHICRFHLFWLYATNISTNFLFAALAIDRHRKTKSGLPKDSPSAPKKAKIVCAIISISSVIFATLILVPASLDPVTMTCYTINNYQLIIILRGILALTFVSLVAIVVVCYSQIFLIIRRNHRTVHAMQGRTGNSTTRSEIEMQHIPAIRSISMTHHIPNAAKGSSNDMHKLVGKRNMEHVGPERSPNRVKNSRTPGKECTRATHGMRRLRSLRAKNQTTIMMFRITMIYFITWMCNWAVFIYRLKFNVIELGLGLYLTGRMFMLNTITNPIFYMVMSSRFRERAKELLSCTSI